MLYSKTLKAMFLTFLSKGAFASEPVDSVSCRYSGWGSSDFSISRHGDGFVVDGRQNGTDLDRYTFLLPGDAWKFSNKVDGVFTCSTELANSVTLRTFWGQVHRIEASAITISAIASTTVFAGTTYPTRKFTTLIASNDGNRKMVQSYVFDNDDEDRSATKTIVVSQSDSFNCLC